MTQEEFEQLIATLFPDNNERKITPELLRAGMVALADTTLGNAEAAEAWAALVRDASISLTGVSLTVADGLSRTEPGQTFAVLQENSDDLYVWYRHGEDGSAIELTRAASARLTRLAIEKATEVADLYEQAVELKSALDTQVAPVVEAVDQLGQFAAQTGVEISNAAVLVDQRASAAETAAGAADASATYADAKAEDAEISAGLAQQRAALAQQWAEGTTPGGAGTKSAAGHAADAAAFAAAVPAQVARVETQWRRRQFVDRTTFADGIGTWTTQASSRISVTAEAGKLVLNGAAGQTNQTQVFESGNLKAPLAARDFTASVTGVANGPIEFRFQVFAGAAGTSGALVYTSSTWHTFVVGQTVTFSEKLPVVGLAAVNVRLQFRNYAGVRLEISEVTAADTTPEAAFINLQRGLFDLSGMREAVAGGAAANAGIAAANTSILQAAFSAPQTGQVISIPRGRWPMTSVTLPDTGNYAIEMAPGAILAPVAERSNGFFRQSGWSSNSLYIPKFRTYGFRIEPFTYFDAASGVDRILKGNPLVARLRECDELFGWHFTYGADQAFVVELGDCQVTSPYIYTEDTGGGTGGARFAGGYDSIISGIHGRSGDDSLMLFGGHRGMYRCGYRGARISGARARLILVATSGGQGIGDVVDCFATDIVGIEGGISTVALASSRASHAIRNFVFSGQSDQVHNVSEYGPKTAWRRPEAAVTVLGNIETATITMLSRSEDARQSVLVTQAQLGEESEVVRPRNITINLSGSIGDHVPGIYGGPDYWQHNSYVDNYGHIARVHGADDVTLNFDGFRAGSNRYGVSVSQSTGVNVTGSFSMADGSKPTVWAPDSTADIEAYKLFGFGDQPNPYPDPQRPHNVDLRLRQLRVNAPALTNLGRVTAETARLDDVAGGADLHIGWAPVQGIVADAKPAVGSYIAGTAVALRNPSVAPGGSVLSGYRRLTTGAAHVFGVDWGAVVVNLALSGPENVALPVITGDVIRGQTLACSQGTWSSSTAMTYSYQWRRSINGVVSPIAGATASTYTLVAADDNAMIDCVVTAQDAVIPSAVAAVSVGPILGAPTIVAPAAVAGSPVVGQTLQGTPATYIGLEPINILHRWLRNGEIIAGVTQQAYTLTTADIGAEIRYRSQASNSIRSNVYSVSEPIGPILESAPT